LFVEAKRRATAKVETPVTEEERQPAVTFVPVPTPTPLTEVPFKELVAECIERILTMTLTPSIRSEVPSPYLQAHVNQLMQHAPVQERIKPVRIGICGLLPDQFRRVKEQINGKKVELVLVSNQYNPSKEDWKQSMDYAVISRFVRHGHHEQAKSALVHERVRWVSSGTESVVAMVSELVPGSVN